MDACRLCLADGHDIFPRAIYSGGLGARLMTIGQAPGITEKEAGRPFNAGSGTRLFQWLAEAGIEESWYRATQYMTSVTKCYPGRAGSGSGDRVPSRGRTAALPPLSGGGDRSGRPPGDHPHRAAGDQFILRGSSSLAEIIGTEKQVDGRWIVPLPHPSGASRWHQIEAEPGAGEAGDRVNCGALPQVVPWRKN